MRTNHPAGPSATATLDTLRELVHEHLFHCRHRAADKHFTRRRRLTFGIVIALLLQKTARSIQLHLHAFFAALDPDSSAVSPSSWCEARLKLRHTAFIELNERAILEVVYGANSSFAVRRWNGHRVLAIDSSLIRLPNEQGLGEEFGWAETSNHKGSHGRYPQARLSVLTDVLNRIAIQTFFVPWKQGERSLAMEHVKALQPEDVAILDRGFCSYELWAHFVAQQRLFVCRCPNSSFGVVNELFHQNKAGQSVVVTLQPVRGKEVEMGRQGLPGEIVIRFVTVRLPTGELEVLASNLLDEERYRTAEFGPLYGRRWGIETFYGMVKGRLVLENFSGLSVEAVKQDVYATMLLSNLEAVIIEPAQEELARRSEGLKNRQQVNHAVSFHAIKSQMLDLVLGPGSTPEVLRKLHQLCLDNAVACRPGRVVPRRKQSAWRSYHYQRNIKKAGF